MTVKALVWRDGEITTGPRVQWVDAGKGLAIVLVVLFHAARWLSGAPADTATWQHVNDFLSTLRMPLFFTLSGLFAAKWANASFAALWNTKLRLFAWVFVLWETIGLFAFLLGNSVHGVPVNLKGQAFAMLISPALPRFELWFIWALAIFFIAIRTLRGVESRAVMITAIALSVLGFSGLAPLPSPGWSGLAKYFVFFYGGMIYRRQIFAYVQRGGPLLHATAVTLWLLLSCLFWFGPLQHVPAFGALVAVVGVAAGVATSRALQRVPGVTVLGTRTLPIYVAHTPIIILCSAALTTNLAGKVLENSGAFLVPSVAAFAIAVSLLLFRLSKDSPLRYAFEAPPTLLRAGTN